MDSRDAGSIAIPSVTDLHAAKDFQQEIRARLLSIEAKLDHVAQQFVDRSSLLLESKDCGTTKKPRPAPGKAAQAAQQGLPACTLTQVLPNASVDASETDQSEAVTRVTGTSREQLSGLENSESECENDYIKERSHGVDMVRALTTKDLSRGTTWMRHVSPGSNTVQLLSDLCGVHSAINWFKLHGRPTSEEIEHARARPLWILVHGSRFRLLYSIIILVNIAFVGALTEAELWKIVGHEPPNKLWILGEVLFFLLFLLEIVLRLLAERKLFLIGPRWKWNIFDMLVLLISTIEVQCDVRNCEETVHNVISVRILRLSRLMRIMRVVRIMRTFHNLWLVVLTIFESLSSVFSCFLVIGGIIFIFAVVVVQGVTAHLAWQNATGAASAKELELREVLLELYGGIPAAAICLFMMVSGGLNWRDGMIPMKEVHGTYEYLLTFYIFFMVIVVLNVVIGAFVATSSDIAARDRELIVKYQMTEVGDYFKKVRTFFSEADVDGSGKLSFEEFKAHLKHRVVSAYFNALGIDVSQAETLFKLLDRNKSGMLSLDEFIAGCIRLRGHAKSLDVNLLLHETKQVSKCVMELRKYLMEMGEVGRLSTVS